MPIQMLQWPQKTSYEVHLNQPLKKFIHRTFDNYDKEATEQACKEIDELRRITVNKAMDANQKATETIARYHDQIQLLMSKVPLLENGVAINWNWKDAFDARKQVNHQSGHWELSCVLYNYASLQTALAAGRSQSDENGLKQAVQYLTSAAGIADHLASTTVKLIHQERLTKDLRPESLRAFSTVCVAQAQEMVIVKFAASTRRDIQAKLAQQCATLYADAVSQLQAAPAKPVNSVEFAEAKKLMYEAHAQWRQGEYLNEKQSHGECIARLMIATEKSKRAIKLGNKFKSSGIDTAATEIHNMANKLLTQVKKDNDFIYHDRVPPANTLTSIENHVAVKPIEFKGKASKEPITDMFGHLVPLQVQSALTAFEQRRKFAIKARVDKVTEMNNMLDAVKLSLAVDSTVDSIFANTSSELPPVIKTGAENIRNMGGLNHLSQLFAGLAPSMRMNQDVLNESQRLLDDEASQDEAYRVKFGVTKFDDPKWPRKPSSQLNHGYATEIAKYRSIIENAMKADGIVTNKMNEHKDGINVLSLADAEIFRYLGPQVGGGSGMSAMQNDPSCIELRDYREQANALKAVREVIEHQLRNEVAIDMAEKFGMGLAQDGFVDEEKISTEALDSIFVSIDAQIKEQEDSQDTVARNLERLMAMVNQNKGSSTASDIQYQQQMKLLIASENAFKELDKHLKEGTKFYGDLTQLLLKNQGAIQDFCASRKLEADELTRALGEGDSFKSTVEAPKSAVPSRPPQPSPRTQNVTPARPPPPSNTVPASAAQPTAAYPPTPGYQQPPQAYGYPAPSVPYPVNNYGMPPHPYGAPPQQYGAPPQQYGAPPQQYGMPPQQAYGMPPQPYGSMQHQQPGVPTNQHPAGPGVDMFGRPMQQQQQQQPPYGYPQQPPQ